jgi:hypothetical protein
MLSREGASSTGVNVYALQGLDINANAEISDATQSFNMSDVAITANGAKVAVDPDPFDDEPAPPAYVFLVDTVDKKTTITTEGETATEFLNGSLQMDFSANLTGVDPLGITASAQRASDEVIGLSSLALTSESGELDLSGGINLDGEIVNMEALNDAGLKLVINSAANGSRSGTLVDSSNRKVADVVEEDGKLVLYYVDETVEVF